MTTREKPARSWELHDLHALGDRGGKQTQYLKAIPVIVLDRWVRGGRREEIDDIVRTDDLERRIVKSGLHPPFIIKKAKSGLLGALSHIQNSRNLTDPILVEPHGEGEHRYHLIHYEPLFQEYRKEYQERYPEDYKKLFPENEPKWNIPISQRVPKDTKKIQEEPEIEDIQELIDQVQLIINDHNQQLTKQREMYIVLLSRLKNMRVVTSKRLETPKRVIVDEELREDCTFLLMNENTFIDAIRRAGVVLEQRLINSIGGDASDKYMQGVELVDYALNRSTGRLVISTHPAEQEGVHMLFRGAVQFIRNPPAHKKLKYTEFEAWQTVGLIDYLLYLLRQAKPREK